VTAASANAAGGPPFVVELVGLPGAGKSTLVAALLSELAAGGARITGAPRVGAASTRLRRGRALLNALSREPGAALGALAAGGLDRAALGRVTHFLGRLTQARTLARGPWDLVLLDEGPLQALFTLSALQPATIAGPSVHVARRVAAALPVGRTVLLLVDVDPAEAARRLSQRPVDGARSRFDGLSPAALTPPSPRRSGSARRARLGVGPARRSPFGDVSPRRWDRRGGVDAAPRAGQPSHRHRPGRARGRHDRPVVPVSAPARQPPPQPPPRPLRVLLVAAVFPPYHTGAGRRFLSYAPGLAARGIALSVLSATPSDARAAAAGRPRDWDAVRPGACLPPEVIDGVPVQRVRLPDGPRRLRSAVLAAAAARRVFADPPDVVLFLEHSVEYLPALAACRARAVASAVAYTLLLALGTRPWRRPVERLIWPLGFELADGVVTSSAAGAASLQTLGVDVPVTIIPNGVDTTRFRPCADADERQALRVTLGLPADAHVVVFLGAVTPRKGADLALQAFERVVAPPTGAGRALNAVLVLAGPWLGGGADTRFLAEARATVARLGARVLAPGQVSQAPAWLRAADVLLFPSAREGLPNTLLEAMASGCPVVTTRFAGFPTEPDFPADALVCVPRTVDAFVDGLRSVLTAPDTHREAARRACAWVRRAHDRERVLDAYAAFFFGLAGARRR
jgi:glycosyltransferase involved in cell wall biosynthesis